MALTPEISTDKFMHGLCFSGVLLTNGTVPSVKADYAYESVVVYLVFTCCTVATWIHGLLHGCLNEERDEVKYLSQ